MHSINLLKEKTMKTYTILYRDRTTGKQEEEKYTDRNECMRRMAQLSVKQSAGKIEKLELKSKEN